MKDQRQSGGAQDQQEQRRNQAAPSMGKGPDLDRMMSHARVVGKNGECVEQFPLRILGRAVNANEYQ